MLRVNDPHWLKKECREKELTVYPYGGVLILSRHVQLWKCVFVPGFNGSQSLHSLLVQEKLGLLKPQQQVALLRQVGITFAQVLSS